MWKNIAIILVALLIIREINLMNESLIISPDAKKVISEDKTILSHIISFIKYEKALFFKDIPAPIIKNTTKKELPTLDEIQPITSTIETLQDIESNNTTAIPKPITKKQKMEPEPIVNKQIKEPENLEILEKKEIAVKKQNILPATYQSAEARVFAILHEMGKR